MAVACSSVSPCKKRKQKKNRTSLQISSRPRRASATAPLRTRPQPRHTRGRGKSRVVALAVRDYAGRGATALPALPAAAVSMPANAETDHARGIWACEPQETVMQMCPFPVTERPRGRSTVTTQVQGGDTGVHGDACNSLHRTVVTSASGAHKLFTFIYTRPPTGASPAGPLNTAVYFCPELTRRFRKITSHIRIGL